MTLQFFERPFKHSIVVTALVFCLMVLALQPAFAYRIAENTAAVSSPADYSTGLTASNTKNIASRTGAPLTATLAISSTNYSSGGFFFGCGGFLQAECARKLQLSNDDVLGARDGGGSNGATSSLFTPNVPVNSTRTANISNAGAWRVLHNLRNCNGSASNQCDGLGTVTLTFSRPVLNPVLHLSELGGLEGAEGAPTGTVHARLTISAVNGGTASAASLTAVSGTNLTVSGTNRIQANSVLAGTNISCTTGSPTQNTGCGSVRVNGTITSIQFAASLYINRISSDLSSTVGDGYSLAVTVDEDFGDAPASYDTDATNGAASHVIGDLRLGASVDRDNINTLNYTAPVVQPSPNAGGNDVDDNGVTYPLLTSVTAGSPYTASVSVSARAAAARICGWIDFNTNGVFDANERSACTDVAASASPTTHNLVWTVPAGATATAGTRRTRVRVSYDTTGVQSPTGRLDSGEVEDALVTVTAGAGNSPLACQSNMYALLGDTTNGFRSIRPIQPNGTLGTTTPVIQVPDNTTSTAANRNNNAGMGISPDGSRVFVTTPQSTLRTYNVLSGSWTSNVTVPSGTNGVRVAVTNNGIGYISVGTQLWSFNTNSDTPVVTGPLTISSINGGPGLTGNGDLFADTSGNLYVAVNPTGGSPDLHLYRVASNGNALFLGTLNIPTGQYGGFASIPSGVYASSVAGNIIRTDLSAFTGTQTAVASTTRGSGDLASCFYPNLNPVIQALKTATKVPGGSAGTDIRPGDTIEYRIVIRNVGTLPAADVRFQDSIPVGTTYVPNSTTYNYTAATGRPQVVLADVGGVMPFATARTIKSPGQTAGVLLVDSTGLGTMALTEAQRDREVVITFRVTVNADASSVSNQGVTTYIDDPGPPTIGTVITDDPNTPEPNDSTTTTILREADLSITKIGTQSANTGSIVSYVIRLTNNSTTLPVNGAVINDTLPAGLSNAYWSCVVPIDGTFATAANIGTRTDEVCVSPQTSATTLLQSSTTIAQTVNLPAGRSVEIRVIGRANGASLSNTASVTVPTETTDPNLANNTTAAVNTSVLAALNVASCNAVKILDANGVSNSAVAWPVQQGAVTPTVSFNRTGTFTVNQAHTAPSVSTGTAPNPLVIGSGTDRFTKSGGTAWTWTATFSQPVPLNQLYLHLNDLNAFDPTVTLSTSGGTATLSDFSGYSSNQSGTAQELILNQSNGQIIRAFNRNNGSEAADSNPLGSLVLLSNSSNTITTITLTSSNTASGDNIAVELGARVGCDYGDAAAPAGEPRAGVLSSYLQMGASIPDTDAAPATPRDFTGDDVTNRDDEDIISVTPQLNIVDTSFSLSGLSVLNATEGAATLRGWIDVNSNNVIDTGELATVAVPTNATAQTVALNWTSLPTLTAGTKLLRFTLLDDTNSLFGEIEDHSLVVIASAAQVSGRVFTDNSGTTAIAANAYNAIQDAGELGLAGSTVELNNCAGTVIATTQTDGAGDYSFGVQFNQLSTPNFCITQTNPAGYTSVSGTAGYARTTDTITIANSGALSYTGHNFGDARLNLVLTSDGQQTTTPSGTVSYPHILRSESVLDVGLLSTVSTENPTLGWTTVLYRDDNCNGTIDAGEQPLTTAIGQMFPGDEVCVVQRVNAPSTASNGAQHVATLSASYTATVQDSGVLSGSSNTRIDTTLVGTAGLDMRKQVRVVEQCLPTVIAGAEPFTDRNTAQNGHFLEYEIIYTNRSTRNLSQLTVRDVAPSSTTFQSATCQSTPSGSGCTAPVSAAANGDLAWSLTNIAPAATGSVRFCVRVPPLAEPPIR